MILARVAAFGGIALLSVLVSQAGVAEPQAEAPKAAAPEWKPFQEFDFLIGSWSGTAESNGRIGGKVSRWSAEMGGNYLTNRGNMVFAAQSGIPEESTEEIGYIAYDRDKRKYVAYFFYSTAVVGFYDVEFPSEGVIRFISTSQLNFETGARTRVTITKKTGTEVSYLFEVAPAGKDFVPFVSSKMARK